jgi:DNA mismatch endonuclease (patch repair protein)
LDNLTSAQRSAHMARIRATDTGPEMVVRRAAHALGLRFRLHRRDLPGSPDLVFPGRRRTLFVHGCYWHRHPGCRLAYSPKSNTDFWQAKFNRNVARDAAAIAALQAAGWQADVIWECETRRPETIPDRLRSLLCQEAA